MRKLATLLSMLLVLSICLTAAAPLALAQEALPSAEQGPGGYIPAAISWTPASLNIPVALGETQVAHAAFSSRVNISRASLVVSFPLSLYVRVEPREYPTIIAGRSYPISLTVMLPRNSIDLWMPPAMAGTIQVIGPGTAYGEPLYVTITPVSTPPPIQWTPSQVRMELDTPEITPGPLPVTTTEVSFTTGVTITNARIRPTSPLDCVLDLSMTGPVTLTPGVTYTIVLTAHLPTAVTPRNGEADVADDIGETEIGDSYLDHGSARRLVSGEVQVYTHYRVYAKSLPVTVVFTPVPVQPVITWRPPLANMRVAAGESATMVVTMTSSLTVENAALKVTGPISSYVLAAFSQTDPVTILPNKPYAVTLVATSPATVAVNRLLMGDVVVTNGSGQALHHELKVTVLWYRPPPTPTPTTP